MRMIKNINNTFFYKSKIKICYILRINLINIGDQDVIHFNE